MARGVNKVILVGNCGQDPETKYSPSGSAVTNLSVATSETWKDKQTGQKQERTEWHRVVFFNRLAEIAGEYLKKGSKVYIEGKIQTRKWKDQNGQDRYTTEIVGGELQMLDAHQGQANSYQQGAHQGQANSYQQGARQFGKPPTAQQAQEAAQAAQAAQVNNTTIHEPPPGIDDFDDDIPF